MITIGDLVVCNNSHMLAKNYDSLICSHFSDILIEKGKIATVIDSSSYTSYFLGYKVAIKVITSSGTGWGWCDLYSKIS